MTQNPRYSVILRPLNDEDGGGWIAIVPDLPGCISDGATGYEAFKNALGAIESWEDVAAKTPTSSPEVADRLGELLRQALTGEPDALVDSDIVGVTVTRGYRSLVDGRFDLSAVAIRFVEACRFQRLRIWGRDIAADDGLGGKENERS